MDTKSRNIKRSILAKAMVLLLAAALFFFGTFGTDVVKTDNLGLVKIFKMGKVRHASAAATTKCDFKLCHCN